MGDYNILDFGAVANGTVNNVEAIQRAIDTCSSSGGGRVIIPADGVFSSGRLEMKSNVELYVERGAVLAASGNAEDFAPKDGEVRRRIFIYAKDAENIAFSGGGIIDGSGRLFVESDDKYIYTMKRGRPYTFFLIGCKNVTYRDITIRDGALWTIRITGCQDVVIHGIRIYNDLKLPNNDGIDIDHCKNVRISDCYIEAGDDCIVMKTYQGFEEYGPCENVTVTGCTLICTSFAINLGCETRNTMRDMVFDSCVIKASHRGIGVHLSDQADVENIIFSNMVIETRIFHDRWWGKGEPIYVVAIPWTEEHGIGRVRNIRFNNILCRSENGVFIYGCDQDRIDGILLENVRVELDKWSKWPGGLHDLRPSPYKPEIYEHPTAGFFLKNARNVTLRNCEVAWGENIPDYFRHALESHNVENLKLENFKGESAHPDLYEAMLID